MPYQNCPVNNLIWRYVSFSCYRLTNELGEWYLCRSALCIATHHYCLFGRPNSLNLYIYLNHHSSSWFLNRWFFVIWIRIKHTLPATICVNYTRLVLPRIDTILNSILIFRDSILTCNRLMTFLFTVFLKNEYMTYDCVWIQTYWSLKSYN